MYLIRRGFRAHKLRSDSNDTGKGSAAKKISPFPIFPLIYLHASRYPILLNYYPRIHK